MSFINEERIQIHPLLWTDARSRLCDVLKEYLRDVAHTKINLKASYSNEDITGSSFYIRNDLDLYLGSLLFSVLLLVLTCFSFLASDDDFGIIKVKKTVGDNFYKVQMTAATFLCCGSIFSLWIVRRRRFLCVSDSDNAKKREVVKFLRALEKEIEYARKHDNNDTTEVDEIPVEFSGTAQTDIYPVYRTVSRNRTAWSRVPSLLLVEGDYIALQVGDVVPANCVSIISNETGGGSVGINVTIGDRISLQTLDENSLQAIENLPKGRTTLPPKSKYFLTLCNNMQIFRVMETPLKEFIRRPSEPTKPSLISRKVDDIRKYLARLSIPVFCFAILATFVRPNVSKADFTLIAQLPILAALGILPVVGPFFIFCVEALGVARVLATVHPFASTHMGEDSLNRKTLLFRYSLATVLSRLSLWEVVDKIRRLLNRCNLVENSKPSKSKLVRVPPATLNMLEKLGMATALALIDDELACEPDAIPQQLLIPSGGGLKLLDLCPEYEDDSDNDSVSDDVSARKRGKSFDSDSESDDSRDKSNRAMLTRKILRRRGIRRHKVVATTNEGTFPEFFGVQFEEPNWWQHLPSLKCIGLACLINDRIPSTTERGRNSLLDNGAVDSDNNIINKAQESLAALTCTQRRSQQLQSLAECIGFSTEPNSFGAQGDISPFREELRIHVLSNDLFRERLKIDAHERSTEQSRWLGRIRPDSTSVVVKDSRTNAYQLLTIGDPRIVTNLCNEAWQGEISTILPLSSIDKQTIIETTNDWKLADLDVAAFCYSPVPHTMENMLVNQTWSQSYLFDHSGQYPPLLKDKTVSREWTFIRNQIFLGVLGSLVVPRREIQKLLGTLSEAGVRFVYFSPRNMRRQKGLAIQMGIDVAWNCAISLRSLGCGEEDPHRMVSNYADWDVNAKLPHGVENVRKHLEEVDNVPLLVSLFTDATKVTTRQMVDIFQEYNDTVISIGLSHLTMNDKIFAGSDIAVGIDVLSENFGEPPRTGGLLLSSSILPSELEFVSSIAAHSCAFRFRGAASVSNISTIIAMGRTSLEAAVAASVFCLSGCISFSFFVLFSLCMPSLSMTYVPLMGAVLFLQIILPGLATVLVLTDGNEDTMKRVPPKNDKKIIFGRKEGYMLYSRTLLKAFLPALLPQILHPFLYGHLMLELEPELLSSLCPGSASIIDVIKCDSLSESSSGVKFLAAYLSLSHFMICIIIASAGYVHRFHSIVEMRPWKTNHAWAISVAVLLSSVIIFAIATLHGAVKKSLPWYFFVIIFLSPFICLAWVEWLKVSERRLETREEKLRRLQFETRLGAWSPI